MFDDDPGDGAMVMPLVLCRDAGGPHDEQAFASGWRLGAIAATLAQPGVTTLADSIRPEEHLQADLLAMASGYTMTVERAAEWLSVTFRRAA